MTLRDQHDPFGSFFFELDSISMLRGKRELYLVECERDSMREACEFNAQLMDFVRPHVRAGVLTSEIDALVHEYTLDHNNRPACLGYQGFPKSCCTSVNEVVCHGIPGDYELQDGDIVNVDVTSIVNGWLGDQSETFLIGDVSEEARMVTQCALDSMFLAINALTPGCRVAENWSGHYRGSQPLRIRSRSRVCWPWYWT